jgi:hypothetical protein
MYTVQNSRFLMPNIRFSTLLAVEDDEKCYPPCGGGVGLPWSRPRSDRTGEILLAREFTFIGQRAVSTHSAK